jgi:glucokinase
MARADLLLGIDLGGSKIMATVFDRDLQPLGTSKRDTKAGKGYAKVLQRIAKTALEAIEDAEVKPKRIAAVGIGAPGPVAADGDTVVVAANLGWKGRHLGRDLGRVLDLPVRVGNDVNCGILGEAVGGAAAGLPSAFGVFVGTGLGGGLVVDGRIINGAHGFAGEIGHMPLPGNAAVCGCGQTGCLETIASKTGLVRLIRAAVEDGVACRIDGIGEADGGASLKSSQIRAAFRGGCPATRQAVAAVEDALAWGLVVLGQTVDPAAVVLGGGVMEALGSHLRPRLAKRMRATSMLYARRRPDLRLATLGDAAVATGAAALART